jgi:alpha-L-fucosidase 2
MGLRTWYKQPAEKWTDAIPTGNGRLGAMIFGKVTNELIQLNEDTLWSGFPEHYINYEAAEHISEARQLIFGGKYSEAEQLIKTKMIGKFMQAYQPLGNIKFNDLNVNSPKDVTEYCRDLDLNTAISTVSYKRNNVKIMRELFISAVDQALFIHFSTEPSQKVLTFELTIDSDHPFQLHSQDSKQNLESKILVMKGNAPCYVDSYGRDNKRIEYDPPKGMRWETRIAVKETDGQISVNDTSIKIENASVVTIFLVAATSFNGFQKDPVTEGKDESKLCDSYTEKFTTKSYDQIVKDHIADYSHLFGRVELDLGTTPAAELPTDERINRLKTIIPKLQYFINVGLSFLFKRQRGSLGKQFEKSIEKFDDPQLIELYFQYGRYLLISSSREGTQPANLQGIWNNMIRPPWASNYTININTEMNYWLAETCNLPECHEPLLRLIQELSIPGKQIAEIQHKCNGWCANHNTTLWRNATPSDGAPQHAYWPFGGAWLSFNLWEHYLFSLDGDFLKNFAYPLMKGVTEFCLDWLIEDKKGNLVTCPATSPENRYKDSNGTPQQVHYATTCDLAIIRETFKNMIGACNVLGIDKEFAEQVSKALNRLHPYQIGKYGQLQEWVEDFDEPEPGHRHMSHLICIHPGTHITPDDTPELANACRNTLLRRISFGGGATGWSCAWKINQFARMKDPLNAYRSVATILRNSTYINLFDAHPPFQIDGNFGATAGIAEMLVQSHNDVIEFLPALPLEWNEGYVKGLKVRGNCVVDIFWKQGFLEKAILYPQTTRLFNFRNIPNFKIVEKSQNTQVVSLKNIGKNIVQCNLDKGKVYEIHK